MVLESAAKPSLGCRTVLGLAEDSRTTDFRLWLSVLVFIKLTRCGQLWTYVTGWSELSGLISYNAQLLNLLSNQALAGQTKPWLPNLANISIDRKTTDSAWVQTYLIRVLGVNVIASLGLYPSCLKSGSTLSCLKSGSTLILVV